MEADLGMESNIADVQHRRITSLDNSHGVSDVNCIAWCPTRDMQRTGTAMFATCGDDCTVRVWKLNRVSAS
jgi:WD40 repeat protein